VAATTSEERVVVAADGPTWDVARLRERYGEGPVRELAVRKVGVIERDRQTVYACRWDKSAITRSEFRLGSPEDGSRTWIDGEADSDAAALTDRQRGWLVERTDGSTIEKAATERLERLGYL